MNLIRWTLFFARTWAIPFFLGFFFGALIITWSTIESFQAFGVSYAESIESVIQSCAK